MRKLLRPKEVLMLGLAGIFDLFEEVKDPFGLRAEGCKVMYGWVPEKYKRHNFTNLIWRSVKTSDIEKVEKNGEIYLRLTRSGKERVREDFKLMSLQQKKWDGLWRVVLFDIKERSRAARELLRLKLKELGFGMLQRSVWITPHDILIDFMEFLEAKNLREGVVFMKARQISGIKPRKLAEQIWKLDKLNNEYKKIENELKNLITSSDRKKKLNRLRRKFIQALLTDPFMPVQLLPQNWLRDKLFYTLK